MTGFNDIPEEVKTDPAQTVPPASILLEQLPIPDPDLDDDSAKFLKNIDYSKVVNLASLVDYLPGQVASRTLTQNKAVGITLFAIAAGEGISAHKSTGDAFVTALEGKCNISIDEQKYVLASGESIVMPAGHPHALQAPENFKMLLVVVFK